MLLCSLILELIIYFSNNFSVEEDAGIISICASLSNNSQIQNMPMVLLSTAEDSAESTSSSDRIAIGDLVFTTEVQ